MFSIGLDIGSSSVKAALVDLLTQEVVGTAQSPTTELPIAAPQPGWAEQDPEIWYEHCTRAIQHVLRAAKIPPPRVISIGLAYQMHGLVAIDREGKPVRPAIIWCDSRAIDVGDAAFRALGQEYCLKHLLNSPANFTASKLRWVFEHEPRNYERIRYVMLPGDYVAYRLTGEVATTVCGLSEGILWDYVAAMPAHALLKHWEIDSALLPPLVPVFGRQGVLHRKAAEQLGLAAGTSITYRAGDQPNNALALGVLCAGEAALSAGTSGVVYAATHQLLADTEQRVNSFAHVNYRPQSPSIGLLLCLNGCGALYHWLRRLLGERYTYAAMDQMAADAPAGADGLTLLPFGNGAERLLNNRDVGARLLNLQFNRHTPAHLCRGALEGIACTFAFGIEHMKKLGFSPTALRAGSDGLFRSALFAQMLADVTDLPIALCDTSGAAGAARAAAIGLEAEEPPSHWPVKTLRHFEPMDSRNVYATIRERWLHALEQL
ncbi:MAG: FGGY family carbohydrate kinase [Saprospiraceae bacterium]|nr:FGGY family carbohydrate kinase [Saprospiraceae bacterium]MDW8485232.1 FGGY family carbohydrate kinase [Saprospiraceae bacterium]